MDDELFKDLNSLGELARLRADLEAAQARLQFLLDDASAHWSTHEGYTVSSSGYSIWVDAPRIFGKIGDPRPDKSRLLPAIDAALAAAKAAK